MREQIVQKLNKKSDFELDQNEILYIVKNWIELQSQHHTEYFEPEYDNFGQLTVAINLDENSIFKV